MPPRDQSMAGHFKGAARTAVLLTACLAAAASLAGRLGGAQPEIDVLNHLTLVWLLLGGLSAGILMLFRGWHLAATSILLTVIASSGSLILARQGQGVRPGSTEFRVVQFNVLKSNASPDAATQWIIAQNADVVVLEEAARIGAAIARGLDATYPYSIDCLGERSRCSTMILSRQPPLATGGLAKSDPENQKGLSAAWARFNTRSGSIIVVGVHYTRPWPFGDQASERAQLAGYLDGIDRRRIVMVGDFNQTPWTDFMQEQEDLFGLARIRSVGATWPSGRMSVIAGLAIDRPMILPIDHIYLGSAWRASRLRRGPHLGSDHRPLVMDLRPAE